MKLRSRTHDYSEFLGRQWGGEMAPVVVDLIETDPMQRLKGVSFLGAPAHVTQRREWIEKDSRFTHSVGVAALATRYCDRRRVGGRERNTILAAALLHDVGHMPLSHSSEPEFERLLGVNHKSITQDVIAGDDVWWGGVVGDVLDKHDVPRKDVERLVFNERGEVGGFFGGPINFDTIEGISRCLHHNANALEHASVDILDAALDRSSRDDESVVDRFWNAKGVVYNVLLGSRVSVLADVSCRQVVADHANDIALSDAISTDDAFFEKLPRLRHALTRSSIERNSNNIMERGGEYVVREYRVNLESDFFNGDDEERYTHRKWNRDVRDLVVKDRGGDLSL